MSHSGKVVVALSGGVDSSVAAALAVEQGFEVVGVTLKLKHPDPAFSSAQLCASKNDEAAISDIVRKLGISHVYLERFEQFRDRVLRPAAQEYLAGRTPNPCCDCNLLLKFGELVRYADEIGAEAVLTGHYATLQEENGIFRLYRGDDPLKDQSYFLYRLTQRELSRLRFPVGNLEKRKVRELAARFGLVTSNKPDSQDACFQVPGEAFGETLRRLFALDSAPGVFRFRGKIVGRHNGIHQYTIGQRKGLRVALGKPAYISAIHSETHEIDLETEPDDLLSHSFEVEQVTFQSGAIPEARRFDVQIRYRSRPISATVEDCGNGVWRVTPDHPLRAVTPGQAAVFYQGRLLLGGGRIRNAH